MKAVTLVLSEDQYDTLWAALGDAWERNDEDIEDARGDRDMKEEFAAYRKHQKKLNALIDYVSEQAKQAFPA